MGLPSQTFVTDLMRGFLRNGHEVLSISKNTVNHDDPPPTSEAVTVESEREKVTSRVIRGVLRRVGDRRLESFDWSRAQRRIGRSIEDIVRRSKIDVAYVDFGKMGVFMLPGLLRAKIPFVVHFHGFDITRSLSISVYRQQLHELFFHASALIVASDHIRRLLIMEGASAEKIRIVRLGVHIDQKVAQLSWAERNQLPPTVVFLGRLVEKKNPVALVEAFRIVLQSVPEARLIFIGDGPERERLESRIARYGLEHQISLRGTMVREKALPLLNQAWVYAQHSVTARDGDQEGFGVSLAEAAALGIPVVSTWHNGIPEQVVHNETGLLVLEHDFEAMATAIRRLLDDAELRQRMGLAGQENILQLCDTDRRVNEILSILQEASR